jgi:hypothetical protein
MLNYNINVNIPDVIIRIDTVNNLYSYIPINEANRGYQEYLAWVAEGNVAEEWNPNGN